MTASAHTEARPRIEQADLNRILSGHEHFVLGRGGARASLKGQVLDGCILANRMLNEADLSGASLVGANLHGSSLVRASLYCADLRRCNLRNSTLVQADIRGACFKGADLAHAVLDNADLRSATMMVVGRSGVSKIDHGSEGEGFHGVDFSNCSLRFTSFGKARLDGANFSGALLLGTNFRGARLTNATFIGAVLMGINIAELDLPPESFVDCVFDIKPEARARAEMIRSKIAGHQDWVISNGRNGSGANLDGEDLRPVSDQFTGRSLVGLAARGTLGIGVDFSGCQLQGAKFDGADLRAANFSGADLCGASFYGAKLNHACFERARIGNLPLRSGALLPPNFTEAEVDADQFQSALLEIPLVELGLPLLQSAAA